MVQFESLSLITQRKLPLTIESLGLVLRNTLVNAYETLTECEGGTRLCLYARGCVPITDTADSPTPRALILEPPGRDIEHLTCLICCFRRNGRCPANLLIHRLSHRVV